MYDTLQDSMHDTLQALEQEEAVKDPMDHTDNVTIETEQTDTRLVNKHYSKQHCEVSLEDILKKVSEYLKDNHDVSSDSNSVFGKEAFFHLVLRLIGGMQAGKHIEHNWPELGDLKKEISMAEDKRWSLEDEITKLFNASLNRCFPELEEEAEVFRSTKKEHGDYTCQNVLMIWPKLRNNVELWADHPRIKRSRDVGKAISKNLPESAIDMIEGRPSVRDIGFVTFSLSPKWMAERIRKMLLDGEDTWAPKLPVERVLVKYPSLDEEIHTGLFRRKAIADTILCMFWHSKVDAAMVPPPSKKVWLGSPILSLERWFSIKERTGHVQIGVEDKPPFILAEKDLYHLANDLEDLRYGFQGKNADLIVCVAPVRQQEYIEMCFTAARLEGLTPTDGTSYVGYRTCNIKRKELANLLSEVKSYCYEVAQGEDAKLLGYNTKAVSDCVLRYTFLKSHRLANCAFTSYEMVGYEGNTFVYLLNARAKAYRITSDYREDIDELVKDSELIVEIYVQSERALELHLLEFTKALKSSCSYISPHILCDYLYELSKQFTIYCDLCKGDFKSFLLLCEATRVVMDRCFILLGIMPDMHGGSYDGLNKLGNRLTGHDDRENLRNLRAKFKKEKELVDRCIAPCFVSVARDPRRNSRFEAFSIRSFVTTDPNFEMGKMFGFIAVSDKYGSIPDGGSHIFEPDFAYIPLFDYEWCDPIDVHNREYVCLGDPSSPNSVAFSSFIEIIMEIYVTVEKKACFEVCRTKVELDLLNIWGRNVSTECGRLEAKGKDGYVEMYYMLIKDAVDAALEIRYKNESRGRKVRAQIYAYYGSDILDHCLDTLRPCYWALLFRSDVPIALEELGEKIPLRKAVMAVPKGAPLQILAHLYDTECDEVILDGICELSSLTEGSNRGDINGCEGTGCSLSVSVEWKYG